MKLAAFLANELKARNNPTDMKAGLVGYVTKLNPLTVSIDNGQTILTEGEQLIISEWFRIRCEIDKTSDLSEGVAADLTSARGVSETHSYGGAPCSMPSAIDYLASAVEKINTELLKHKCDLKVGDMLILQSTNINDRYFVIDKVLGA